MTRIEYLSDRCIKGLASEEELLELQQMIADPQYSEKAAELLRKGFLQVPEPQDMSAESSRQIRTAILDAHRELKPNAGFVSFIRRNRWMAAASVLLLVTLAVFFIFSPDSGLSNQNNLTNTLIHDVKPGRDGAILTLADGSQLVLDSLGNGIISTSSEAIVELKDGFLSYSDDQVVQSGSTSYHTLTTPKGRQFSLRLPDGTKVWLNAASSIRFPIAFGANERKVEIAGEAYFEVVSKSAASSNGEIHRKTPFVVRTRQQTIEVLGTHFNVNAYEDELLERTTLLEGVVRVKTNLPDSPGMENQGASALTLKPGQQAITGVNSGVKGEATVDVEKVMAWKNGLFNFADLKLEEAMRQISRWYNIDIVYEGDIPDIEFWGKMGRDLNLNDVLRFLDKSGVQFEIEDGKKLIVKSDLKRGANKN